MDSHIWCWPRRLVHQVYLSARPRRCHTLFAVGVHVRKSQKRPVRKRLTIMWGVIFEIRNPFAIDSHVNISCYTEFFQLWRIFDMLHIRSITSCTEDTSDLGFWVDIMRCNQCPSCIVDNSSEFNWEFLFCKVNDWEERLWEGPTYFSSDFRNISATSRPSVLVAPKPFVQRIKTPWSILVWLKKQVKF